MGDISAWGKSGNRGREEQVSQNYGVGSMESCLAGRKGFLTMRDLSDCSLTIPVKTVFFYCYPYPENQQYLHHL